MSKYVYYCPRCREFGVAEHENTEEKQNCRCGAETMCTGYTLEEWNALPPAEKDRVAEHLREERPVRTGPYDGSVPAFSRPAPVQPARPVFAQNATKPETAETAAPAPVKKEKKRRRSPLLRGILLAAGFAMLAAFILKDVLLITGSGAGVDSLADISAMFDCLLSEKLFYALVLFALSAII